jgi:hypothetical protein
MSTYANLNYHFIFSTKNRLPFIEPEWQEELYAYIGGILRKSNAKAHAIGGVADHIHILASLRPTHLRCGHPEGDQEVIIELGSGHAEQGFCLAGRIRCPKHQLPSYVSSQGLYREAGRAS